MDNEPDKINLEREKLKEIFIPFLRKILQDNPTDIVEFCANYFQTLSKENKKTIENSSEEVKCRPLQESVSLPILTRSAKGFNLRETSSWSHPTQPKKVTKTHLYDKADVGKQVGDQFDSIKQKEDEFIIGKHEVLPRENVEIIDKKEKLPFVSSSNDFTAERSNSNNAVQFYDEIDSYLNTLIDGASVHKNQTSSRKRWESTEFEIKHSLSPEDSSSDMEDSFDYTYRLLGNEKEEIETRRDGKQSSRNEYSPHSAGQAISDANSAYNMISELVNSFSSEFHNIIYKLRSAELSFSQKFHLELLKTIMTTQRKDNESRRTSRQEHLFNRSISENVDNKFLQIYKNYIPKQIGSSHEKNATEEQMNMEDSEKLCNESLDLAENNSKLPKYLKTKNANENSKETPFGKKCIPSKEFPNDNSEIGNRSYYSGNDSLTNNSLTNNSLIYQQQTERNQNEFCRNDSNSARPTISCPPFVSNIAEVRPQTMFQQIGEQGDVLLHHGGQCSVGTETDISGPGVSSLNIDRMDIYDGTCTTFYDLTDRFRSDDMSNGTRNANENFKNRYHSSSNDINVSNFSRFHPNKEFVYPTTESAGISGENSSIQRSNINKNLETAFLKDRESFTFIPSLQAGSCSKNSTDANEEHVNIRGKKLNEDKFFNSHNDNSLIRSSTNDHSKFKDKSFLIDEKVGKGQTLHVDENWKTNENKITGSSTVHCSRTRISKSDSNIIVGEQPRCVFVEESKKCIDIIGAGFVSIPTQRDVPRKNDSDEIDDQVLKNKIISETILKQNAEPGLICAGGDCVVDEEDTMNVGGISMTLVENAVKEALEAQVEEGMEFDYYSVNGSSECYSSELSEETYSEENDE